MSGFARYIGPFLLGLFIVSAAQASDRAIIVLDASGSMWGQIDGKPKLEIARQTLKNVLRTIPADMELGLMAYGHRTKGSCSDIELVVPPAAGTASAIAAAADSMKFLGKTPLSAAVKQAAEDLRYTEDKATVILITDGIETCGADPCALGKELEQAGVDFTAHVVGFGLTAEEGRQVACLAENTGGKYIQAGNEDALEDALEVVVAPEPEPTPTPEPANPDFNFNPVTVLSPAGEKPPIDVYYEVRRKPVAGSEGERVTGGYNVFKENLEPGDYVVLVDSGEAEIEQPLTIEAGKVAEPTYNLNAGVLILRTRPAPGADVDDETQIIIDYPGDGVSSSNYGQVKTVVPAGETTLTAKLGAGEVNETVQIAAGQTIEKEIIVGVGRAKADAFYTAGGEEVESVNLSWKIFKAPKRLDGTREQVAYAYGPGAKFDLPPGDYVAGAEMQAATAEQPFSIAVGEFKEVGVALNAGVVAITAPGADGFRIFEAKKDLQGERKQITYGFGETLQTTMVAGDYVVVTNYAIDKPDSETPFSVKAGERTELAVP
ncbi:MAG: VWA domain-containing protein [Parvibaculaceae bacterium]